MKKLFSLLFAVCAAICMLCACSQPEETTPTGAIDGNYQFCLAYTATNEVLNITEQTSLKDYIDALAQKGMIEFSGSKSTYGFYLESVYGITSKVISSTANGYEGYDWMIYTSLSTLDGVNYADTATSINYNGITLYLASYGADGLPVVEGYTYAFVYKYVNYTW